MNNRILVVEDNSLNRELLCDWLEAEGHEVLARRILQLRATCSQTNNPTRSYSMSSLAMRMGFLWRSG